MALFHLDESPATNGAAVANTSGYPNEGILTTGEGAADKSVAGLFGGGIQLDGIDDYIATTNAAIPTGTGEVFAVCGWDGALWSQYEIGVVDRLSVRISSGNVVYEKDDAAIVTSVSTIDDGTWHHVAVNRATNGAVTLYIDGLPDASGVDTNAVCDQPFRIGVLAPGIDPLGATVDETAVSIALLGDSLIESSFLRGALDLRFQVRSCDDASCIGEGFAGPDGTTNTWFSERMNTMAEPPTFDLTMVPSNRYFQYRTAFATVRTNLSPRLMDVEIGPDHYDPDLGSVTVSQGTVSGLDPLRFELGTIAANTSATITIEVTVATNTVGTLANHAEIVFVNAVDLVSANDDIEETTEVGDADGDGIPDFIEVDDDGDVMPDDWEIQFGFNRIDAGDALLDFDDDGLNNRGEYIADTDPTNSASRFELTITADTNQVDVTVDTSTQRVYTVESLSDPADTNWTPLAGLDGVPGQGLGTIYTDGPGPTQRTYRVNVELP